MIEIAKQTSHMSEIYPETSKGLENNSWLYDSGSYRMNNSKFKHFTYNMTNNLLTLLSLSSKYQFFILINYKEAL